MDEQKMMEVIQENTDLLTIGTWMMEAIPDTLSELQELCGVMDKDYEISDEDNTKFYKALWKALYLANAQ